ncbi:MAG: ATP-dependent DNA ligase [Nitriliruptorales bacterium]|nr:ATP-dependent DNA ligase [Nitriliruptorales bacterium]
MTTWPFDPPLSPMEARVRTTMPGQGWAYEPKWDGFRCLAWSGPEIRLDSRNERPLLRYFPELTDAITSLPEGTVVDGEVVIVRNGRLDFDSLQLRLHPAESRVEMLSEEIPARLIAFDLLAVEGRDLLGEPFLTRRAELERLLEGLSPPWYLTPSTTDQATAERWFDEFEAAGCDGIVAKEVNGTYELGKRAMAKIKHRRSVDCVVGGYRVHKEGDRLGSLLLGLYDANGELHFIGHCSGFPDQDRIELLEMLERHQVEDSFGENVRRPGQESRWSGGKDLSWHPVAPGLVVQVSYDQLTGERFRHATRFERWRPDKDPRACTMDQLDRPEGPSVDDVVAAGEA